MKPVKQTKLHQEDAGHNGNCYAACLASMLDLPLWMVPAFEEMAGTWRARTDEWLGRCFGLRLAERGPEIDPASLPEFYIANGPSPRGVKHSVIYSKGHLAHDPHPSNAGIASVEWIWTLEPAR